MIDGMGGSLAITSALGAGTTVEISLQGCTAEVAAPTRRTA
jgi:hypothetical protein